MPRLETFSIRVKTGETGREGPVQYLINSFPLEFEQYEGGVGAGEMFEGSGNPGSFPHSLVLRGPDEGAWDIEEASVTYQLYGEEPYTVRFGAVSLDDQSDLNIWAERPAPVFDV